MCMKHFEKSDFVIKDHGVGYISLHNKYVECMAKIKMGICSVIMKKSCNVNKNLMFSVLSKWLCRGFFQYPWRLQQIEYQESESNLCIVSGPQFYVSSLQQGQHMEQKYGNSPTWTFQTQLRTWNLSHHKSNSLGTKDNALTL